MNRVTRISAVLSALLMAFMVINAPSAQADAKASGALIANVNYVPYAKCATPAGNGTTNGTRLTYWECTGHAIQEFEWNDGNQIVHKVSGKCITPSGDGYATNGAVLTLWTCNSSSRSQDFIVGDRRESWNVAYSFWGGLCATGYGNSTANGTQITLWTCSSSKPVNQNWGMYLNY